MPDFVTPLDEKQMADDQGILARLKSLDAWRARLSSTDVKFESLDEASTDMGAFQYGNFISGTGTPQGGDLTGTAVMYPPVTISGIPFTVVGMNNGILQFGLSAVDGTAWFAGGISILNSNGLLMTGLYYPVIFTATNAGNTRTGRFGMTLLPGSTVPSMQWDFESAAGATLVVN